MEIKLGRLLLSDWQTWFDGRLVRCSSLPSVIQNTGFVYYASIAQCTQICLAYKSKGYSANFVNQLSFVQKIYDSDSEFNNIQLVEISQSKKHIDKFLNKYTDRIGNLIIFA